MTAIQCNEQHLQSVEAAVRLTTGYGQGQGKHRVGEELTETKRKLAYTVRKNLRNLTL